MRKRKILALLLTLCLLLSALPLTALADYTPMNCSDNLIEFIKKCEGFTKYATWDYQHYSIGYGCSCNAGDYPNGITEEQADALLRTHVAGSVNSVNSFCQANGIQPQQSQFDCMVSLSYALGPSWMDSGYNLPKLMVRACRGQCSELELLDTMGDWINAGGRPLEGIMNRRMRETFMFFHAEYNNSGYIEQDVPYGALWLDANGGTCAYPRVYTVRGMPYSAYKPLPTPVRSGYAFAGWYDSRGNRITDSTVATGSLIKATARWEQTAVTPPPADLFTDVYKSDWFFDDVKAASDAGFFAGYTDGSFRPNAQMSRAMFAQVLYRIAGQPKLPAELPFADVAPSDWFHDAVCWAYASGIVNGVSETSFAPDRSITREQMATMLYKYSVHMDAAEESDIGSLEGFSDAASVSGYAETPLRWAVGTGLINGMGDGRLSPATFATRAQASAILIRLTGMIRKGIA